MPAEKIELDLVQMVVEQNIPEKRIVAQIMEDLRRQLEQKEEKESTPRQKKEFAILVSDPEGHLEGKHKVGWVLQIPEGDDPAEIEKKIASAAIEFNTSPKGRKLPVSSVGEACEAIPPKFTKDHGFWIKTKEAVQVLRTKNKLSFDGLGE
ncbi:MAG: hypothetical protein JJT96_14665 [Opitutales bacterium]|nr:hypothetical protein [Opitutales bacterium]